MFAPWGRGRTIVTGAADGDEAKRDGAGVDAALALRTGTRAPTGVSATCDPQTNAAALACEKGRAGGFIVLARHGEPALSRKIKLNAAGYRRWWAVYEAGGILAGQTPPAELLSLARRADVIIASTRKRALETAQVVAEAKSFGRDPLLVEAPLPPPPLPPFVKFGPKTWGVLSRMAWWFFGHHAGEETRREAQIRAKAAAERLVEQARGGANVLVLAHGFFNRMIGVELQRLGWRSVDDRGYRYWATRRFERA